MGLETTALQKNAAIDFESYLLDTPQQTHALVYGLRPANPAVTVVATACENATATDTPQPTLVPADPAKLPELLPHQRQRYRAGADPQ